MKMAKRLPGIMLAAVMAFALTACGASTSDSSDTSTGSIGEGQAGQVVTQEQQEYKSFAIADTGAVFYAPVAYADASIEDYDIPELTDIYLDEDQNVGIDVFKLADRPMTEILSEAWGEEIVGLTKPAQINEVEMTTYRAISENFTAYCYEFEKEGSTYCISLFAKNGYEEEQGDLQHEFEDSFIYNWKAYDIADSGCKVSLPDTYKAVGLDKNYFADADVYKEMTGMIDTRYASPYHESVLTVMKPVEMEKDLDTTAQKFIKDTLQGEVTEQSKKDLDGLEVYVYHVTIQSGNYEVAALEADGKCYVVSIYKNCAAADAYAEDIMETITK